MIAPWMLSITRNKNSAQDRARVGGLSQSLGIVEASNPADWANNSEAALSISAILTSIKLTPPNTKGSKSHGDIVANRKMERSQLDRRQNGADAQSRFT